MKEIGLYVHFPFCLRKCKYCDFNSYEVHDKEVYDRYIKALCREIIFWKERLQNKTIKSIFFGGGTPSILSINYINDVIESINNNLNLKNDIEFSIECNPGTLNKIKLSSYYRLGINRLSIGVQALQDKLLKILGRIHNTEDFINNYYLAREVGFNNINVDLMFALPSQTFNEWRYTVDKIVDIKPEHISAYSLKIEENTVFYNMLLNNEINEPDQILDRKMYYYAIKKLNENGYKHYEISNFSKPKKECIHNLIYWNKEEYIGVGAGAHSYLECKRFSNEENIEKYIQLVHNKDFVVFERKNNIQDEISEYIFLGLRKIEGIKLKDFEKNFNSSIIELFGNKINKLVNENLVAIDKEKIALTKKGIDFSNLVFLEFLPDV